MSDSPRKPNPIVKEALQADFVARHQSPLIEAQKLTSGPWRDGRHLVLHPYDTKLPKQCVKTGTTDDTYFESYELPFRSRDPEYDDFTLKMDVPLSQSYVRWRMFRIATTVLLLLLSGCLFVAFAMNDPLGTLALVAGLLGGCLVLASVPLGLYWSLRPPLRPVGTAMPYIWLTGAHPEFLSQLPTIPEDFPRWKKSW